MTTSRRDLLLSAAAAGLSTAGSVGPAFAQETRQGGTGQRATAKGTSGEGTRLNALFDAIMSEALDHSPELTTSLGLDSGPRSGAKSQLDDRSIPAIQGSFARTADQLAKLRGIDRSALQGLDQVNYDCVLYTTAQQDEGAKRFSYYGAPYAVSQLTGAYQSVPDFLDSQHAIETKADADAYLARLSAFATALDQEITVVRHDASLGVVPPDFILDKALIQMTALRDTPADKTNLVQSMVRRAHAKGIAGDYATPAADIYSAQVQPALDRQIALLRELRVHAVHEAGVARLPDGAAFYALSLQDYTTSDMAPAEIHRVGLELVAEQSAQIDTILKAQGMSQGTVGQRIRGLYEDPKYRYPNTDEGKIKLIADLNLKVAEVQARLPAYFGTLPKAKLDIRRVPKFTEAGAPGGYYQSGTLDGSRNGAYYINLRDTAEVPSWTLPTLTFHEGIPGHHLQGSLAMENHLPLIRAIQFFSGYGEGWALYAEQLAVEMGMYDHDPLGHVGQLHDSMFRAVRLVVDSGLHAQGWSREQAIRYYAEALGDPEASVTTEVERYCVWPGQACSYMLGKLDWLRLRQKARTALGSRFDIRRFHDAGLLPGAMPLAVLDRVMDDYISAQQA